MLLICYPKCSTCKKAERYLESLGIEYTYRNIKDAHPTYEELKSWYHQSDYDLKRFFNTSGQVYRQNALKDKLVHMSEEEQLKLLASDGMLVKRPLLISEQGIFVGFKENEWQVLKK